jgi:hypothetical protein
MEFIYEKDITPIKPLDNDKYWPGSTYSMFRCVLKRNDRYITYVRVCINNKTMLMYESFNLNWESNEDKRYLGSDINAEDPRIIEVQDKIYVIFIARSPFPNQVYTLWILDHDTLESKPLYTKGLNVIEKNWAPFVRDGKLMFVYNYDPIIILSCDTSTGYCDVTKGSLPFSTQDTFIRGGSNLMDMGDYYMGFSHSRLPINSNVRPGFLHLTHMVRISKQNLELIDVSEPIIYKKGEDIVKETIQDPVSCWIDNDIIYITTNMRDNFCEIYSFSQKSWNERVKNMLENINKTWFT